MTKQLNENKLNIQCEWMKSKRLLINPDGQVFPCCYFANVMYTADKLGRPDSWKPKEEYGIEDQIGDTERVSYITATEGVLNEYHNEKEKYNIHHTPLEEIINSDWFTKTLPESWDNPNIAVRQCKKYCQMKDE